MSFKIIEIINLNVNNNKPINGTRSSKQVTVFTSV